MAIVQGTRIASLARPPKSDNTYQGTVTATAGQDFKIETSPRGEDMLELTVPAGKIYTIMVRVDYVVSDA